MRSFSLQHPPLSFLRSGRYSYSYLFRYDPKSREMAKSMLGFKDLFLVGFFLSIGMSGQLSLEALIIGTLLMPDLNAIRFEINGHPQTGLEAKVFCSYTP